MDMRFAPDDSDMLDAPLRLNRLPWSAQISRDIFISKVEFITLGYEQIRIG
jgi:hypothetical protein